VDNSVDQGRQGGTIDNCPDIEAKMLKYGSVEPFNFRTTEFH
jgi:hypothetical protein